MSCEGLHGIRNTLQYFATYEGRSTIIFATFTTSYQDKVHTVVSWV